MSTSFSPNTSMSKYQISVFPKANKKVKKNNGLIPKTNRLTIISAPPYMDNDIIFSTFTI